MVICESPVVDSQGVVIANIDCSTVVIDGGVGGVIASESRTADGQLALVGRTAASQIDRPTLGSKIIRKCSTAPKIDRATSTKIQTATVCASAVAADCTAIQRERHIVNEIDAAPVACGFISADSAKCHSYSCACIVEIDAAAVACGCVARNADIVGD